jgi:protein gp37
MTTKIEWTNRVWNPVTGCTKVSEACQNCYAEAMARRLQSMPGSADKYRNGFNVTTHIECLVEPLDWKKPSMVFVCSMGDLFHEDVSYSFIDMVMNVIRECPQHTFQILTKRAGRLYDYYNSHIRKQPKNVWLGVTCESRNHYDRVALLRATPAGNVKFISCEPLLGEMNDVNLDGVDWVIAGGESGPRARRTPTKHFLGLRDACRRWNTPFFFKQWGAYGEDGIRQSKYKNGHLLDGEAYRMMPGESW